MRSWLLVLATAACSPTTPGPGIDIPHAMRHVTVLAGEIGVRPGDSERSRRAADYVERELAA